MPTSKGFTLLEMLGVLAIVGVLFAVSLNFFRDYQRRTDFRYAVSGFYQDVAQARLQTRRTSRDWTVTRTDERNYSLSWTSPTGLKVINKVLPVPFVFNASSPSSVVFSAPYGLIGDATNGRFRIEGYGLRNFVSVIGLSGKVVIQSE